MTTRKRYAITRARMEALWNAACDSADVPRDSRVVCFDDGDRAGDAHNHAAMQCVKLRVRIAGERSYKRITRGSVEL